MTTVTRDRLDIIVPRFRVSDFYDHLPKDFWTEIVSSKVHPGSTGYGIMAVAEKSPRTMRVAVETLAWYFKREFRYDFVQYSVSEHGDSRDRVFLWTHDDERHYDDMHHVAIGAICFRWREYSNVPPGLAVAWVWIHPYLRRQGILSAHWDYFRHLYGDFYVEPPLSPAMRSFMESRKECALCGRTCHCSPEPEKPGI